MHGEMYSVLNYKIRFAQRKSKWAMFSRSIHKVFMGRDAQLAPDLGIPADLGGVEAELKDLQTVVAGEPAWRH